MITGMRFNSTRNPDHTVSFTETLFQGLAPDGGLYQFERTPNLSSFFTSLDETISFNDLSVALLLNLLESEFDEDTIRKIINSAFDFQPCLKQVSKNITVLELFHGPSSAFKDFGASFLASAMNHLLKNRNKKAIILTATSGDTGSAVAQAFHGKENIDVVILYPSKRVSPLQEKQLTTLGENVLALEVEGNFDDCQRMVKSAFTNPTLSRLPLSSANSINLGRLLPQSFYYVWAWTRLREKGNFAFIVPSGNFGNITAGLYAASWGMPVKHFVAATNINDVIPEYLNTGIYTPRKSVATLSNAMDVGAPSNYERLESLYRKNLAIFRKHVEAWSVDDLTTKKIIKHVYDNYSYLCCPHTAVGWRVAELFQEKHPDTAAVLLSTAHPGKFVEVVEDAVGEKPSLPESLAILAERKKVSIKIGNKDKDLVLFLLEHFSSY